jgi:hypothetical protein
MSGDTLIYNPLTNTHRRVDHLAAAKEPTTVLAITQGGHATPVLIAAPFIKGTAPLSCYRLGGGQSLTVTGHHKFLTPTGWATAEHCTVGSLLAVDDPARNANKLGSCNRSGLHLK